jgi:ABC-type branched-subunit amino acid transport system permease subunit
MTVFVNAEFWALVGAIAGIYAMLGLAIQMQFGIGGLMNFGQAAYMAIAAYTLAILVVDFHAELLLAIVAAVGAAMLFAFLTTLPAVRLRGDYLAIFTLAAAEIVRYIALNEDAYTGGAQGSIAISPEGTGIQFDTGWQDFEGRIAAGLGRVFGSEPSHDMTMLVIVWAVFGLVLVPLLVMVRSPWGRMARAIREDEEAATALGKRTMYTKMQIGVIGGCLGGLAGVLFAVQFGFFVPDDFAPLTTLYAWTAVILGGLGRIWTTAVGAIVFGIIYAGTRFFEFPPFSYLDPADRAYVRLIIVGALIIALVVFRPQGLFGSRAELAVRR